MTKMGESSVAKITLTAQDPFHGLSLPARYGATSLRSEPVQPLTLIAPFKGQKNAAAKALGARLPDTGKGDPDLYWFADGQWMTSRPVDIPASIAAQTDQSDMWAAMTLTGEDAKPVMSRLCSLDLDAFAPGDVARTEFAHLAATIIALNDGYRITIMRSFARAAQDHTITAMKSIAAQVLLD